MPSKRKSISLAPRVADHDRERKELERLGASMPFEPPSATISRLETEHANLEDQAAGLALEDEQARSGDAYARRKTHGSPWPFAELCG
jgi:hypothetical protein